MIGGRRWRTSTQLVLTVRQLVAAISIGVLLSGCATPASPSARPGVTCHGFATGGGSILPSDDPCPTALVAIDEVKHPSGAPVARIYIEPDSATCNQPWPGFGTPRVCVVTTDVLPPGTHMHGWVSFVGNADVAAIELIRRYPENGAPDGTTPPWNLVTLAFEVPPAGWVMP